MRYLMIAEGGARKYIRLITSITFSQAANNCAAWPAKEQHTCNNMLMKHFSRLRKAAAVLAAGAACMFAFPAGAAAQEPYPIEDMISDKANVLDSQGLAEAREAAQATRSSKAGNFNAVFVDDFSGMSTDTWCEQTMRESSLLGRNVLMVVAVKTRDYGFCFGNEVELSSSQKSSIDQAAVSALSNENWAEAAIRPAKQMQDMEPGGSSHLGGSGLLSLLGSVPVLLGFGVVVIGLIVMARRRKQSPSQVTGQRQGVPTNSPEQMQQVVQQAGSVALEADNAVRAAEEDVLFARAQFGATRTDSFEAAYQSASKERDQALGTLNQMNQASQLQDKFALANQVLQHANTALQIIQAKRQEFEELSNDQAQADKGLQDAEKRIGESRQNLQPAKAKLENLHLSFPGVNLSSIDDNVDQANALLDSAAQTVAEGKKAFSQDNRASAVEHLHLARRAITQANGLLSGITNARQNLAQSNESLLRAIGSISSDLDDVARENQKRGQSLFEPLVAEAKAAIEFAQQARAGKADPLAAAERIRTAEDALDNVLDPIRQQNERDQRKAGIYQDRKQSAQSHIAEAESLISPNRGMVDVQLRSLVSGAKNKLENARQLENTDITTALTLVTEADKDALEVINQMRNFTPRGAMGNYQGAGGIDIGSFLLGGLLSGGHHSSWGSSDWGSSDWGSSDGGFGGGSFGGGGGFGGSFGGGKF